MLVSCVGNRIPLATFSAGSRTFEIREFSSSGNSVLSFVLGNRDAVQSSFSELAKSWSRRLGSVGDFLLTGGANELASEEVED